MNVKEIRNIESEAGIIASIIIHPDFIFYSDQLKPNHFTDPPNAYIYFAVSELAKKNVGQVDAYAIINVLNARESTRKQIDNGTVTVEKINGVIDTASIIARHTVEAYQVLVKNVLSAAFKRSTYNRLLECEKMCFDDSEEEIQQKIYSALDSVMMDFSTVNNIPQYKDVVDQLWGEIEARQSGECAGIPFKFEELNKYATIERGELFIFAADAKQGKSAMLLNCAVDLMKRDVAVFYIDSELNSRLFTCRLISHLTGIKFGMLRAGRYDDNDRQRIAQAIAWLKTRKFTHLYVPSFDVQSIYLAVKKVKHTQGLDVLIVDYFKGRGEGDAFDSYQELGRFVDLVKNQICGEMNIAGIGAAQATSSGKIADSAKIARNASTIALLQDKTPDELQNDGVDCGNKKLRICFNRNGAQMPPDQYLDLYFNGDTMLYKQAKQHTVILPY